MGRLKLARCLHMSNSRVCDLVQDMLDEGLLIEEHSGNDRRGRRGVPIVVNPSFGHFVGFDMEAKRLRLVATDFAGNTIWQSQQPMGSVRTRQKFIDRVVRFIESGLEEIRQQCSNLLGIGLAVSGLADVHRGLILRNSLIEAATDVPIRDLVADHFNLPCIMEDNIRALTLAEWQDGAAQDLDDFVCLAIRTGVAAGLVMNGRMYAGGHGFAGEAGYAPIPTGTSLAQWKCFQELVSEDALDFDSDVNGANLSKGRARRAGELLGAQMVSIAAFFDPQAIILAGGLVRPDGPLWDHAERAFRHLVMPELVDRIQIRPARLGPFAAAVGATHRCFQYLHPIGPMAG